MKTNLLTLIIALLFIFQISAQSINQEIIEKGEAPFLLGKIDKSGLESENYNAWFSKNHNAYEPNSKWISDIAPKLKNYAITLFMGTWCGDSKAEVPKIYKVLEACDFPMEQLTLIAVSRKSDMYKQSPQHEEAGLNIHRVPTLIFYKDGKEINRIVEHPIDTFEEDIQNIITVNDYKSNYQIVANIEDILKSSGIKGFKKNKKRILKTYKDQLKSMHELNTYAHILFTTNRQNEALEVLKLNTKLFPTESYTYMSLGNKLSANGDLKKALKQYKKAQKLDPENEQIQKNILALKSM
ncbi:tetratricopeptide repeat protein [Winogradskyella forsetii]|uniref:tetratricopeptide repeat protein n=1 Tax=Winogradskyella forsetii TaxID=2686077 RepID=UPI0015C0EC66|nr:tetratricopeptide repeat protein [Winogradskyella forsetii]